MLNDDKKIHDNYIKLLYYSKKIIYIIIVKKLRV